MIDFLGAELLSFILNKLFKAGENLFNNISNKKKELKIENFYKVLEDEDFKRFEKTFLKKYYTDSCFTTVNGREYPVYFYRFSKVLEDKTNEKGVRKYDFLSDADKLDTKFDVKKHKKYKELPYYREYSEIVGGNIRFPDRPGYMLDELVLNSFNEIEKVNVHIGTYAENVYSNHVLEFEMVEAFKHFRYMIENESSWDEIRRFMRIRNSMHKNITFDNTSDFIESMKKSLSRGDGRDSLLSVQMLVLMKDKRTKKYLIKIIQRSTSVAIAPGRFQIVPSGGFEILNDSDPGYSEYELRDNLSPGCAVFREYLEEIFGAEEFEGHGKGSVNEALLKDEKIKKIEEMLLEGSADFRFLGSIVDLAGLRNELSFVLVIKDSDYATNNKFLGNEESISKNFISGVSLDNFEEREDIWDNLHGPSAVMWQLFKDSDLYNKLINEETEPVEIS